MDKNEIISGKFNIIDNDKMQLAVQNISMNKFINYHDINNYNTTLFDYNKDINILSILSIESLNPSNNDNLYSKQLSDNIFIKLIEEYDVLIIHQGLLFNIIFNDNFSSNYSIIKNQSFNIKNHSIRTFITSKDLNIGFFIKIDKDNNIVKYKKIIP